MTRSAFTLAVVLAAAPALAADSFTTRASAPAVPTVSGTYVEARTAEVFAGGCIMNSEAETMGRQAVLAWRVDRGQVGGVSIDGLSVVAALSGTHNLGMREMGGEAPTLVKTLLYVDERATGGASATRSSRWPRRPSATSPSASWTCRPCRSPSSARTTQRRCSAGDAQLQVEAHIHHDPSCGAMLWFHPLSRGAEAEVGLTRNQTFTGQALGTRWQQIDKRSAFVGTFAF